MLIKSNPTLLFFLVCFAFWVGPSQVYSEFSEVFSPWEDKQASKPGMLVNLTAPALREN